MNQSVIFAPVFVMMFLTMVVWVYMYVRRIAFIQRSELGPEDMRAQAFALLSPPAVANPSDNLKNLFEMPVLFYTVSVYLFVTNSVDPVYLGAAWVFVAFRVLHSALHCTINVVIVRFYLYLASSLSMWFMMLRAAAGAF